MDVQRINAVLREAIVALQESEVSDIVENSARLEEAAERVNLMAGQLVTVRSKKGKNIIKHGRITQVDPAIGVVRVRDVSSGTTLEVDVDPEKYLVWVVPPPDMEKSRLDRVKDLYVRNVLKPNPYQGGKWPVVSGGGRSML